jgi:hypothetical protein
MFYAILMIVFAPLNTFDLVGIIVWKKHLYCQNVNQEVKCISDLSANKYIWS